MLKYSVLTLTPKPKILMYNVAYNDAENFARLLRSRYSRKAIKVIPVDILDRLLRVTRKA